MKIDETWFKLYQLIYGNTFNRLFTIGNDENGYANYTIQNLEQIKKMIEEFPNNEFYISLYNYTTEENILQWNTDSLDKYEQYSEKKYIIFRFRQNSDMIQEEVNSLNDIQKFMFIRRSINLGFNKEITVEAKKVYNFFKTHFGIKGKLIFNGYNETLVLYSTDELNLNSPSLTYYHLLKLMEEKLELNTLTYENIEPYAQLMPLPGTQNKHSRLYVQFFHPDNSYEEIMRNSQKKFLNPDFNEEFEKSDKLHDLLIRLDDEIKTHERDLKYNFDDIWNNI